MIDLLGDDAQAARAPRAGGRARARHALARGRAPLPRELRARARRSTRRGSERSFQAKTLAKRPAELPEPNLDHVHVMTDQTGILQHAAFNVPRYEDGYCLDDNARALLLMALIEDAGSDDGKTVRALASRYLAFVSHAFDVSSGRFRNFMSYSREWIEERGSEDSHGRALWALGTVVGRSERSGEAESRRTALPCRVAGGLGVHESARLGVRAARDRRVPPRLPGRQQRAGDAEDARRAPARPLPPTQPARLAVVRGARHVLQRAAVAGAHRVRGPDGARGDDGGGLRSLEWLAAIQRTEDGYFAPIGSNGFYPRAAGRRRAFDQQPVEACAMVSACLEAAPGHRRRALDGARAVAPSTGSSGRTSCSNRSTMRPPAAAATGCTPIG